MTTWRVTIKATVTKTYEVEAETKDEATETAHSLFSVAPDDVEEDYDEQTEDVEKVEENEEDGEDGEDESQEDQEDQEDREE